MSHDRSIISARRRCAGLFALLLAAAFAAAGAAATGDAPQPEAEGALGLEDFAVGRALIAAEPGGLQSVLLDFDVYRRSVEGRLADLRVFDAQGRPAPYAIRRRLPERRDAERSQSLPLFRVGTPLPSEHALAAGDYRFEAELSATGAIVRLHRDRDGAGGSGGHGNGDSEADANDRPSGWLLDASAIRRPIVGIELDFEPGDRDFVEPIRIDRSGDLARWTPIDSEIAVARLSQAGHRIERTRFDLPNVRGRYLRLTPNGEAVLPRLRAVRVRLASRAEALPRLRHRIQGRLDPDAPGVVLFDLDAEIPIERLRVVIAEPGTFVDGRLESAARPEGPWRVRSSDVFYLYERQGQSLRNAAVAWQGSRDRFVRLVTSTRGGGLRGSPPEIEIEWIPEQLVYLDRGFDPRASQAGAPAPGAGSATPTSTLAIGRIDTPDDSFQPEQLLRTHRARAADLREPTARLGPERVLAGDAALERNIPIPWRTYGLWALLVTIVGIVVGLGLRLLREVDAGPEA